MYGLGEEGFARLAGAVLVSPRVAEAFSWGLQRALETKGRLDRNMQMLLGLFNLPSQKDVNRLLTKIETIQGSLVNLNLKVDRLLASGPPRRRGGKPPTDADAHDSHE